VALTAIEIGRSDWKSLTKQHLSVFGEQLSLTPDVVGVWTAVEDEGTSRQVERLQAAVVAESADDAANYVLRTLSHLASRHRLVLAASWSGNPSPDTVPADIAKTLGLRNTVNQYVTVGEVFLAPPALNG
jgi:hypothetical protein